MRLQWFIAALGIGALSALAQAAEPSDAEREQISKGKQRYTSYCARCHGINMMVAPGSAFFDLRTFPLDEKPRFVDAVLNGKRVMPAWRDTLTTEDVDLIWSYVSAVKR
jgi:cytochrome c55X